MNTLYEIIDGGVVKFGTKLATNSLGKWIMEVKSTSEIIVVDKEHVTEVMPYTVGVKFSGEGQEYHYFAVDGDFVEGDNIILNGQFAVVTAIDTRSRRADTWLDCFKLAGTVVDYSKQK